MAYELTNEYNELVAEMDTLNEKAVSNLSLSISGLKNLVMFEMDERSVFQPSKPFQDLQLFIRVRNLPS